MSENIISLGIFIFTSFILIGIGISQLKSKEPVGFYTGEKPPRKEDLSDVALWNKKHGTMWILYGVAIIGSFFVNIVIDHEFIAFIIFLCIIIGALPVMIFYHHYLMRKYLK